jgi:hypothetical protein
MEYWFAMIKVVLIILFIIVGLIYDWGGVIGHPGPVCHSTNHLANFISQFCTLFLRVSQTFIMGSRLRLLVHLLKRFSTHFFLLVVQSLLLSPQANLISHTNPYLAQLGQHLRALSFSTFWPSWLWVCASTGMIQHFYLPPLVRSVHAHILGVYSRRFRRYL